MKLKKAVLVENLRAWKLIEVFTKSGIPFFDSFKLVEDSCKIKELKSKFTEFLSIVEQRNGGHPDKTWEEDYFLFSTKVLFAIGWMTGTLDSYLKASNTLIRLQLNMLEEENKETPVECHDIYLLTLTASRLHPVKIFEVMESELKTPDVDYKSIIETSKEAQGVSHLVDQKIIPISDRALEALKAFDLNGDERDLFNLLEEPLYKKWLTFSQNEKNKNAKFYRLFGEKISSGRELDESFKEALKIDIEEDFRSTWQNIFKEVFSNNDISSLQQANISKVEKALFKVGLETGMLDQALIAIADLLENPM